MRFTSHVLDPQEETDYPDRPVLDKVQMETKMAAVEAMSPKALTGVFREVNRRADAFEARQQAAKKAKSEEKAVKEERNLNMQSGGLDGPDLFF